jgi:MSHA biogenesis protein MshO
MRPTSNNYAGFTLVELIVVITLVAILAAGAALFIRNPTQAYFDTETRANLTDRADTALRRMARDVRNALPNSVRAATSGADTFVEFLPINAAGRYRAATGTSLTDNPLDFSASSDTFDVLGSPVSIAAGDKLVIYNLGIIGADAYEGSNMRSLNTIGTLSSLSFSGGAFPLASPSSRFYVVSTPVTYACDMTNRQLVRYSGYTIQNAQSASIGALNGLATAREVAGNVSACQITYATGALQRSGIVTIALELTQDTAKVKLLHQITVVNSP